MIKNIEKTILNYASIDSEGNLSLSMQVFDEETQEWEPRDTECPFLMGIKN